MKLTSRDKEIIIRSIKHRLSDYQYHVDSASTYVTHSSEIISFILIIDEMQILLDKLEQSVVE